MLRPKGMALRWPLASVSPAMAASSGAASVMPGSTAKLPPAAPAKTSMEPPGPATNSCPCRPPPPDRSTRAAGRAAVAASRLRRGACRSMRLSGAALRRSSGRCKTQVLPPLVVLPQGTVAPSPDTDVRLPAASVNASPACSDNWPCGARSTPAWVNTPARSVSAPPADNGSCGHAAAATSGRLRLSAAVPTSRLKRLSVVG